MKGLPELQEDVASFMPVLPTTFEEEMTAPPPGVSLSRWEAPVPADMERGSMNFTDCSFIQWDGKLLGPL